MWTEEKISTLLRLHADNLNPVQIGLAMGTTRNAVMGKLFRLGLSSKKEPRADAVEEPRADAVEEPHDEVVDELSMEAAATNLSAPARVEVDDDLDLEAYLYPHPVEEDSSDLPGVRIMALRARMCRWPVGTDADFRYCGKRTDDEKYSYCPAHSRIAYVPTSYRKTYSKSTLAPPVKALHTRT